jgi:hypothetical protein
MTWAHLRFSHDFAPRVEVVAADEGSSGDAVVWFSSGRVTEPVAGRAAR